MAWLDAAAGALERSVLRLVSPGGMPKLSIFIYHRVLPQPDPLFPSEVDQAAFDRQMALVKARFNVLPLLDAVRLARSGALPPRAACITFDDGYADNAELALPILQRHGLNATFFIATGFLNGGRMWNDSVIELVRRLPDGVLDATSIGLGSHALGTLEQRRQAIDALIRQLKYLPMEERLQQVHKLVALADIALPDDLMLNTRQLHRLRDAGMGLGAHTVNHPILARLPAEQAQAEIARGKQELEALIGSQVALFAYPNGKPGEDYLPEHVQMVRELGFEGAVSTAWGSSRDTFQLPRFTPWDRSRLRSLLRLSRNLTFTANTVG